MSWCLSGKGCPSAVKSMIENQAISCKACCAGLPTEQKVIEQTQQLINTNLDFHIEQKTEQVEVSAFGSGCLRGDSWGANMEVSVSVRKFTPPTPVEPVQVQEPVPGKA